MWSSLLDSQEKTPLQVRGKERARDGGRREREREREEEREGGRGERERGSGVYIIHNTGISASGSVVDFLR
jgi:hypothetical protein